MSFSFVLALTACTSNFNIKSLLSSNQVNLVPPNGTSSDSTGAFSITRALKNSLDPTGVLDVIGDGSGTLGNFCGGTDGAASTTCTCAFSFNTTLNPNQTIEVPVSYSEPDLVRCPYTTVPTDATTISLTIHLLTGGLYSGTLSVKLNANSNTLDSTAAASFIQVQRYQCRQGVTISGILGSSIYDPFQSEDFDPNLVSVYVLLTAVSGSTVTFDTSIPPLTGDQLSFGSDTINIVSLVKNTSTSYTATLAQDASSWTVGQNAILSSTTTTSSAPRIKLNLTYPLDFYASNLALALSAFSGSSGAEKLALWNCPSILNPRAHMSAQDAESYELVNRLNFNIYSRAALPGLSLPYSKLIFPLPSPSPRPSNSDRSTFYLAKKPAGLFSIPVDAYMAPGTNTSSTSTTAPSLGYGARPIATTSGETCPGTSLQTIPAGYHWVKVWLFRASLDQRQYLNAGSGVGKISEVGAVVCNPGNWPSTGTGAKQIFDGCPLSQISTAAPPLWPDNVTTQVGHSYALEDVSPDSTHYLADRVLFGGQCVRFDTDLTDGPSQTCTASSKTGPACAGDGLDRWSTWHLRTPQPTPSPSPASYTSTNNRYPNYPQGSCGKSNFNVFDPLSLCTEGVPVPTPTGTATPTPSASPNGLSVVENNDSVTLGNNPVVPKVTQFGVADADTGGARYDYLFVASPPDVMVSDMHNLTAKALQYWPYRFKTREDCTSNDPDSPTAGDCHHSQKITYFLKLHNVSSPEDPPGSAPDRTGDFPVCAIQPDP